jgi:hypothetical protein
LTSVQEVAIVPSMPWGRPIWRVGFDVGERAVGLPLEALVRTEAYMDAVALTLRTRRETAQRLERISRRALHLLNLPAGSDIRRVNDQLARLDRHVVALSKQLEP